MINGEYIKNKYEAIYGPGHYEEKINKIQTKFKKRVFVVVCVFLFLAALSFLNDKYKSNLITFSENGNISEIIRPLKGEGGKIISTKVWLISKEGKVSKNKEILIEEIDKNNQNDEKILPHESKEEKTERELSNAIRSVNKDTNNARVILPNSLEDGTRLIWQEGKESNYVFLIIGCFLLLLVIFRNRFDEIKKEEYMARESIIKELPSFINKLVLTLGAGLVVTAAFSRILQEENKKESYFYNQLILMEEKIRKGNSLIHVELASFAKRSGVHELMRFSNIITDNIYKGGELINKLKQESNMLWFARKKQSEEKGRRAETKLTIPLVILLIVLIMVTITPAMLQI